MRSGLFVAALLLAAAPAAAQNLSLQAPAWAQTLVAGDVIASTGGRAVLASEDLPFAARVTIAPLEGGVARVIRYEAGRGQTLVALRRFTGHPRTGWWLWGGDTPLVTHPSNATRDEINGLVRAAMNADDAPISTSSSCQSGEQAYVEIALAARSVAATRACVSGVDAVGRLATRLSTLAGSRNEEELHDAAQAELLAVDTAFHTKAQADGVGAAFAEYAAEDAVMFNGETPVQGHEAVVALFADWPAAAKLEWRPQLARVSDRGDMGWTWGTSVYTAADGTRRPGRYVTTWKRDGEGRWRFAFDSALR